MSKESWIAEFYPVDAKDTNPRDAATHSLQKWRGLTREELDRHELVLPPIDVDASTCALCWWSPTCSTCAITLAIGDRCTDRVGGKPSAWGVWVKSGDPCPMINLLERVVEWEKSNEACPGPRFCGSVLETEMAVKAQARTYMSKSGRRLLKPSIEMTMLMNENGEGFCLACGGTQSGVEPDAVRIECEGCGEHLVYGAEDLVMRGLTF